MRLRPLGAIATVLLLSGCVTHTAAPTAATGVATNPAPAPSSAVPTTASCAWPPATLQSTPPAIQPGMDSPLTPPLMVPATGTSTMTLSTNRGQIVIQIDRAKTPCTAASMAFLVGRHFYDHSSCHRLVTQIYALQCGDPTGTGSGGPGYQFADENLQPNKLPAYHPGDVAMANAGPDTNGSQFFFVYGIGADLQGDYPLWGHVTKGLDIVDAVGAGGDDGAYANEAGGGHPKLPLIINSARID